MLTRTFVHIPTVGIKREQDIWRRGVRDWRDFLDRGEELLSPGIHRLGRPVIRRSLEALAHNDLTTIAGMIPPNEHWRFIPRFQKIICLDIESCAEMAEWGGITMVACYDGRNLHQYVAGKNLQDVNHALIGYEVLVTFAGRSFDLPVLKRVFPNMSIPPVHIDLRWLLGRLGFSGGLKRIERQLAMIRPEHVRGIDGYGAVLLWQQYQEGSREALDLLYEYNACDVINLPALLELGVRKMKRRLSPPRSC